MTSVKIIADKKLEDWDGMYGDNMPLTSYDKECMVKEIIKLRKFTRKLIKQREEMYGKLSGAISEILFDSIRNEVDIKTT